LTDGLPRVGSALIVRDEANRILLGKRNKDPQRGNWILPGGKIHAFETIADAAARELSEETGLEVVVQHQFRVYEVINAPQEHRIIIYSWARAVGGDLRASDDVSEVKFVSLQELGDLPLTPLVREVLADAGYIEKIVSAKEEMLESAIGPLFPIAVAGASGQAPVRCKPRVKRRRSRPAPIYRQSMLLFDSCVSE
jgi:ADP-ribose pyrophosphatase YjhB (NUDIX family)